MTDALGNTPAVGDLYLIGGDVAQRGSGLITIRRGSSPITVDEADCVPISGLRYAELDVNGFNTGSGITTVALARHKITMTEAAGGGYPVRSKCRTSGAAVQFVHNTKTGGYTDWTLTLQRDGSSVATATVDVEAGDNLTPNVQQVSWSGGPITFDPASHRTIGLSIAGGSALDFVLIAVNIDLEFLL